MESYYRAKKLYSEGACAEAWLEIESQLFIDNDVGDAEALYILALLLHIEFGSFENFKILFFKIKNHVLRKCGVQEWVNLLEGNARSKRIPGIFY